MGLLNLFDFQLQKLHAWSWPERLSSLESNLRSKTPPSVKKEFGKAQIHKNWKGRVTLIYMTSATIMKTVEPGGGSYLTRACVELLRFGRDLPAFPACAHLCSRVRGLFWLEQNKARPHPLKIRGEMIRLEKEKKKRQP